MTKRELAKALKAGAKLSFFAGREIGIVWPGKHYFDSKVEKVTLKSKAASMLAYDAILRQVRRGR